MGFNKKWFYDACPRCRKSCSNNTSARCEHCHSPLDSCTKSFNLQIKLVDFTGCLWATAFDESASVFLKDMPIEGLFSMSNRELCEHAESYYCYEQYKISIKSTREMIGLVKHVICGKPTPINPSEGARSTLKRIAQMGAGYSDNVEYW